MKLLHQLAKPARLLALLLLVPLLGITAASNAANDVDFSDRELDQMLAPIALYPDTLLSQVLIAATYPLEVIQADRWVRSNKDLKTEDALKFAEGKDWDPSVKSLVAFPDLLQRMSDDTDWTQRLGDAFLADEEAVMDSVQRLRHKAQASGNLSKAQYIRVEDDDGEIAIEPAQERVVYVPVYDTRVVYGSWWYPDYPPVYWHYPATYVYSSGFYWGPSIYVGSSYFYSSCHWNTRRVVVIDRTRYSGSRFYTGRSISYHEGAHDWRHDPVHRHGVAYYNDNLRRSYNSNRPSVYTDRVYRERRDETPSRDPRVQNNHQNDDRNNQGNHDRSFRDQRDRQQNQAGNTQRTINVSNGGLNTNTSEDRSRLQRIQNTDQNGTRVEAEHSGETIGQAATSDNRLERDRAEQFRARMERRREDNNGQNGNPNTVTNLGTRDSTPAFNRTPETDRYVPGQGNQNNSGNDQSRLQRFQERSTQLNNDRQNNDHQNNRTTELTPPRTEVRQEIRQEVRQEARQEARQETRQQRQEGGSRLERIKRSDDKN